MMPALLWALFYLIGLSTGFLLGLAWAARRRRPTIEIRPGDTVIHIPLSAPELRELRAFTREFLDPAGAR
jgi:hypothetical protein